MRMKKKTVGFTLIELLMAIGIGSILFTVGIARYTDFNQTQTLKSAGLNLKNALRMYQVKVNSGVKTCIASETLDGYRISRSSTTRININTICSGTPGHLEKFDLSGGLRFQSFTVFDLYSLNKGSSANRVITVEHIASTKTYKVCVTMSGEIKDCGISTTCSCP